jgi:hypothetical protein
MKFFIFASQLIHEIIFQTEKRIYILQIVTRIFQLSPANRQYTHEIGWKKITRVRAFTLTVRNECKDTFFDIDFYQKKIILQI